MRGLIVGAASLVVSACTTTTGHSSRGERATTADLIIRNVTVIDPQQSSKRAGRDVIVRDGRVIAVVQTDSRKVSAADEIDGRGRFLMPGLMDMHAHTSLRPIHDPSLKMMIANGVTGIREMGSDCMKPGGMGMCIDEMRASQAAIESGERVGPRLLELSTLKVASNRPEKADEAQRLHRPTSADEARATVAGLAERKPDIIKTSEDLKPDVFRALMTAARERTLKVGGHIPSGLSVAQVAAMGMTSIEHARVLPLDCSTFGATYRAQAMDKAMGKPVDLPGRLAVPGKARDTFDQATCAKQIRAMVENGTYYVPTHLTREMDFRAGVASYRADPRLIYITNMQQKQWTGDLDRTAKAPPAAVRDLTDFFALGLRTTKMAHAAGVKVMVGTDANDTMVFPGFSLHDELRHLVSAGLTPMQAIQAATSVPAEYLGRSADFGGVSEGKLADLVLLDADPTANIANSNRINAVIRGGRLMDRAALDALLAGVRQWAQMANTKGPPGK